MGGIFGRAANPANIPMAKEFVTSAIAKDKVVIFSKSYCPYCTMAKEVNVLTNAIICHNRHNSIKREIIAL